jgi:hypothetical protein
MGVLRGNISQYYNKDNPSEIQDLYSIIKNTEDYRSKKVTDLKNEHSLIMRRITRLTQQKEAYIRMSGVLSSADVPDNISAVFYNDDFDTGDSELSQSEDINKVILLRRPADPVLTYTRDTMRKNIPEIEIKIRDYDYQLMRLSLLEEKITYWISNILKSETTAQQAAI